MDLNTYKLPMQVAAALATGRPELLAPWIDKLRRGAAVLTDVDSSELLRLVADLIAERTNEQQKFHVLDQVLGELGRTLNGQARRIASTTAAFAKSTTRDEMEAAMRPAKEEG